MIKEIVLGVGPSPWGGGLGHVDWIIDGDIQFIHIWGDPTRLDYLGVRVHPYSLDEERLRNYILGICPWFKPFLESFRKKGFLTIEEVNAFYFREFGENLKQSERNSF